MQSERWANIGREILFSARSELYMNLPFLDGALAALPVQDGFETSSLATDAKALYFSGAWLAQRFERSRTSVNRAYLHTVFHCLLRHPAKMRGRDRDLWSLACDIAVESLLDSLDYRCLAPDKTSVRRRSLYRSLHEHMPVLTAEAVYRHFRRERMNSYDCATLTRVFAVDEHTLWPEDDDDQDRRWQQQAQRTQTAMDTVFASEATGGEAVREQLAVSARRTTDYRAFLRRFSALREETAIDADSFDYGYYAYGLRHYGNMPLIEPLETRETRKIEDFVIAIDTSMSTSGELVRAFLERQPASCSSRTRAFSAASICASCNATTSCARTGSFTTRRNLPTTWRISSSSASLRPISARFSSTSTSLSLRARSTRCAVSFILQTVSACTRKSARSTTPPSSCSRASAGRTAFRPGASASSSARMR